MPGKRAAIYIRMSTDEQTNSPERQRTQILAYCQKKGYRVVHEYQDLGLRGHDDTRPDFNRLIADATSRRFDVVVVDEQSRLARSDMVKFVARVVDPLRDAGVAIDTVAKGLLDWDDLGGFIIGAVNQHTASGEVVTLSRRVVTELARRALKGDAVAGKPPYGYKQVWVDPSGKVVHEGKRTWTRRPAGVEPTFRIIEEQSEIVKWVYESYVNKDLSLKGIMEELRRRGVLSPRGGAYWSRAHIRNMLTNRTYVGDYVFNQVSVGTYHRLAMQGDGESRVGLAVPKPAGRKGSKTVRNDEKDWVVITDHYPAVVDRELFQRAGAALQNNRERSTPTPARGDYCLSKVLVCARCGSWMTGDREGELKVYMCGGYCRYGPGHCKPFRIREDDALGVVEQELSRHFLSPERIDQLRADVLSQKNQQHKGRDLARLRKRATVLASNIAKATHNVLLLDPELVPVAQAQIQKWQQERTDCARDIEQAERETPVEDAEELAQRIVLALSQLRKSIEDSAPTAIRRAVRGALLKMELKFETVESEPRRRHRLVGGVSCFLNGERFSFGLESR